MTAPQDTEHRPSLLALTRTPMSASVRGLPSLETGERATPAKSRNDLFAVDWSPGSPNVRATPPVSIKAKPVASQAAAQEVSPPMLQLNLPMTPPLDETVWQGFNEYTTSPSASSHHRANSYMSAGASSSSTSATSPSSSSSAKKKRVAPGPGAGHSTNPVLDSRINHRLRLQTTRDFLLGEGRHASVYLASWIPAQDRQKRTREEWSLCAAKRILPDPESQVAGLGEAFILAKLASSSNAPSERVTETAPVTSIETGAHYVMTLYGVKDERDGVEAPPAPGGEPVTPSSATASPRSKLGIGAPTSNKSTQARRAASERQPYRKLFGNGKLLSPPPPSPREEEKGRTFGFFDAMSRKKGPRQSAPTPSVTTDSNSISGPARLDEEEEEILADKTTALTTGIRRGSSVRQASGSTTLAPSITLSCDDDSIPTPRIILLIEFCPFGHLMNHIRANADSIGRAQWFEWAKQLALAVAWCHHRGVLHADIKPQNVLVAKDGSLKLSDFGMSMFIPSAASGTQLPDDPHGLGTPPYSPPEFVKPLPSPFSFPSDIFSLGVTLSVMLTAREPYEGLRTVERMLYVSRGSFFDYEERRRLAKIGLASSTTASSNGDHDLAPASRPESTKSGLSHRSSLGQLKNGGGSSPRSHALRSRSESVDSNVSAVSDLYRPTWHVSQLANRLLAKTDGTIAEAEPAEVSTPTLAAHPVQAAFADPPSSSSDVASHDVPQQQHYNDGTPVQHFLDGREVVPMAVRELIRSMTNPVPEQRPSAKQVFRRLERLSMSAPV